MNTVFVTHPDHPTGVDHWRAMLPARNLARTGHNVRVVRLGADLPTFAGEPPDAVVFNQRFGRIGGAKHFRETVAEPLKMLYVADVCDDPELHKETVLTRRLKVTGKEAGKKVRVGHYVLDHISNVHLVTVNTPAMASVVRKYNPHVEVMPDLLELDLWRWPVPKERPKGLTIGVAGGDTHSQDWKVLANVWAKLAEKYDWLSFVCVGFTPGYLKGCLRHDRFVEVPWSPIDRYPQSYRWIDIGCAPVTNSRFNRTKSPIKYLEYTAAGAFTVASHNLYDSVIESGKNGLLATTETEWIDQLTKAIEHPRWRNDMLDCAKKDVKENWCHSPITASERISVYRDHYRRVYAKLPDLARGRNTVRGAITAILQESGERQRQSEREPGSGSGRAVLLTP